MIDKIEPGSYILGHYRLRQDNSREDQEFGILIIYPLEQGSEKSGQWYVKFRTFEDTKIDSQIKQVIISIACRLGLLPVHFTEEFEKALLSSKPLCLVADTNSLYHGSLLQALRLRESKATHLAIPDQVYMEIQRQRERYALRKLTTSNPSSEKSSSEVDNNRRRLNWFGEQRAQSMQISAARSLQRLKKMGVIVHYIRPPEAMVRYFGSERGSAISAESSELTLDDDGPGYHRDRLILEAVRTQRVQLPQIPVWLVTGDAKLAIQAKLEDFQVGYSWLPALAGAPILTSPYLEPRTLTPQHLAVEELLDEWLWNWENITLQLSGKADRKLWELPARQSQSRTLLELEGLTTAPIATKMESCRRRITGQVFNKVTDTTLGTPARKVSVPARAPSPADILYWLQITAGTQIVEHQATIKSEVAAYLRALNWTRRDQEFPNNLTERGRQLADSWTPLTVEQEKVIAWYEWIREAGQDVLSLPLQHQLLEALPTLGWKGNDDLAKELGIGLKDVASQSVLANAFGFIVRLSGKSYKTEWQTPPTAADLIVKTASQLKQQVGNFSSAVRIDKVFTALLNTSPLSLPVFRAGLFELYTKGTIRLGGSVPDKEGKTATRIQAIVPGHEKLLDINLGAGDFLIPHQSSQVIILED